MNTLTKAPSRSMRPYTGSWLSPFDRFFNDDIFNVWNVNTPATVPSINIREEKDKYKVELAAPGLKKDDFNIDVDGNVVTISCDKEMETKKSDKENGYTRWEYDYSSFSRSFSLPDYADTDKITAKYNDGILHVEIPKKPEAAKLTPHKVNVQ